MTQKLKAILATIATSAFVASCGGGSDGSNDASSPASSGVGTAVALQSSLRPEPLRSPAQAVPTLTDAAFFDWAQLTYPQFFPGSGVEGQVETYHFRYYAQSQTFLAVSAGYVYVKGPVTENNVVRVSALVDFTCRVYRCPTTKADVYAYINQVREGGGFGTLNPDARVEAAAQAHASFLSINYFSNGTFDPVLSSEAPGGGPFVHYELSSRPGFTGAVVADRLRAAGYQPTNATEVIAPMYSNAPGEAPSMLACVDVYLETALHRAALLDTSFEVVGAGFGTITANANGYQLQPCVFDFGSQAPRSMAAGWSGIYPFPGQSGVKVKMRREIPDPVPGLAEPGFPVSIQVGSTYTLGVTDFSLQDASGSRVPATLLTKAVNSYLRANEAYLVPNSALASGRTYTAAFSGTATPLQPGQAAWTVTRTWTFTTQ